MANPENPYTARYFINPVYWPLWLAFGFMRLCIILPFPVITKVAKALSYLGLILMSERRRITRTNIRLCYPHFSKSEVRHLMRENFYSGTMAIFESALSWWGSDDFFKKHSHIEGMEHVDVALKNGKGVLFLGAHYTTLEIGGRVTMQFFEKVTPTYKPARNKLFNAMMVSSRTRIHGELLTSQNLRELLKRLKRNNIIWYAPDQDFGHRGTVFAPFMGVQTVTLTATARIAKSSGSAILPWCCERLADNTGYKIIISPALDNFPAENDIKSATIINQSIENQIAQTPEQYFWGHRRFKTRPQGAPQVYRIRRDKSIKAYTLAHVLIALPVILYTMWIALKHKQSTYFVQRMGLGNYDKADLIIHAASIGEVNAISPLVKIIIDKNPNIKIILSVNTPSGMNTAKNIFLDKIRFCYMPIDWQWATHRYLEILRPSCVLVAETEIWLNFYEYCYYKGIKNIIINARLSRKSIDTPYVVRRWLSQALQYTYAVLARSEEDANRYIQLGVNTDYVKVIGNLKYSLTKNTISTSIHIERPYILIASTREHEERLICEKLLTIKNSPLLVIVPRHIKRLPSILSELSTLTGNISVRSKNDIITKDTNIYIADTFGELDQFIARSNFVIMGGSFEPFGGQNIIEVAFAGKAVIFGPHMENFYHEAKQFVDANAGIQVSSIEELLPITINLINDTNLANKIGKNGSHLVQQYSKIVDRYYNALSQHCTKLND